jgi:hypothetical protein
LEIPFPPVNFRLEQPPHLLVVSPRGKIESIREVLLRQGITVSDMEDIETRVDDLGVSSLVVELGGLAAFPSFVTDRGDIRFTIDTATEEWVHQYLTFRPLGFRYLLDLSGISRDYEIATMNETVAGMVSKEISSIINERYYSENGNEQEEAGEKGPGFDFDREMRGIRRTVDDFLERGEIGKAEEYMEQSRQRLAANGYYIRKLNQAYFAFHGAYADRPAYISPIGVEMKQLRERSKSLKDFLDTVAAMSSRRELSESAR